MRDIVKVLWLFTLTAGLLTTLVVWVVDDSSHGVQESRHIVWILRVAAPIVAIVGIGAFLWMHYRPDRVPDFLRQRYGDYFYCQGFVFAFGPVLTHEGTAWLEVGFQNQHAMRCLGRITLRPARGFFLGRAAIAPVCVEIPCEPAGFGVALIPFPLPREVQGKQHAFDIGASAEFPEGVGELLRFRDWTAVADDDRFGGDLPLAGEILLAIVRRRAHKPSQIKLDLPSAVSDVMPAAAHLRIVSYWRLGDEPGQTVEQLIERAKI